MKYDFLKSMLSEGGKISHKRFISVICTLAICFTSVWTTVKHPAYITDLVHSFLVFIAVMSGVATVAQIVTLVRGNPPAKDEGDTTKPE